MHKIKNVFSKFLNYTKNIINDNGEFNLPRSVLLIFVLSIWTVIYQMIIQRLNVLQLYGPILLFNIIPIFLVMLLFYFITGKTSCSFVITNTLLTVLLIINHFKVKFRDEPLMPTDFSLGKEAKNIVANYDLSLDIVVFVCLVICAVTFFLAIKYIKNKRPGIMISIIGIIVTSALTVGAYNVIYKNTRIYDALLSNLGIYHETTIVSSKGLVYSLINNTSVMKYEKPDGYSLNEAQAILDKYEDTTLSDDTPNLIAVMGEAFTDMQDWDNVSFADENPYDYINFLREKGAYGKIFVPGFAGGTSSTEFEFLTGCNTSAISTSMPTAYKTLITSPAFSIARLYKEKGFEAKAMHPGFPWFYNRQNVYPRFGFDSFTSREDLTGEIKQTGYYADDTVASDMIISDYNRHLSENPDQGYFNFTVTIQNHGPYNDHELLYEKEYISKTEDMTDEEYYIINNYLGGIKSANEFLKTIYEYINTLDKPTVLVFFGDHLPYLDSEEMLYEKLGLDISSDTYQAYENKYSTNYIIIGNDAFLKERQPKINGVQDLVSANYLSVKMFLYMDEKLPKFHSFLKDMMEYVPVLSKRHNGFPKSQFDEQLTDTQNDYIKKYKILQYYNIKDYNKGENQ